MTATEAAAQAAPFVRSYVSGAWWEPDSGVAGTPVLDANTGEQIARASTDGLDVAGAVAHARAVGRAGIQAMTFHERAFALKQLALFLQDRKQEL
ncbi:MAG: phenylacetic acid degradation bifunctional protein PaaZ, partial [Pseudoclavibacter sp.]